MKDYFRKQYKILLLFLGPLVLSFILYDLYSLLSFHNAAPVLKSVLEIMAGICFFLTAFVYPPVLLLINITALVRAVKHPDLQLPKTKEADLYGTVDLVTVILGSILTYLYSGFTDIYFYARWDEELYYNAVHQPVWDGAWPMFFTLIGIGVIGYLVLYFKKTENTPPLITVGCIAAMYIGISQLLLFIIQIFKLEPFTGLAPESTVSPLLQLIPLMILPFCCISMAARLIIRKIYEWNITEKPDQYAFEDNSIISRLNRFLLDSSRWPSVAVIAVIPLLGVILAVLALFGQHPSYLIKTWTETAQWNMSQQTAVPNVAFDEHYLCTVAAGGHEKVVKPLRPGERHGHRITVNRQLLIANAFEQVLEERTPHLHRVIRDFYDTYGYPIARHITNRYTADLIYILMKPLEWIFLIVLYLTDARPEDRIAVQYLPHEIRNAIRNGIND